MLDSTNMLTTCPKCGEGFTPARSNQKFCSRGCQKNTTRGPRTVGESPEERQRQAARSGRLKGLSDAFFETPPQYRAAFMVALITEARAKGELRKWVTKWELLRSWHHHPGTGRLHIAHCLDHFCREVFGRRSFVILDPNTVLPCEEETAFPACYYGPDGVAVRAGVDGTGVATTRGDPALVKALARAFRWRRLLEGGHPRGRQVTDRTHHAAGLGGPLAASG